MSIRFGTDGWRDVIADNFTYANVAWVAAAHAAYLMAQRGDAVVLGHDTRFRGEGFADVVTQTMTAPGLTVHRAPAYIPTPAVSFAVRFLRATGGVVLTASHNPPEYHGYKLKGPYGGSATPSIVAEVGACLVREGVPLMRPQPLAIRFPWTFGLTTSRLSISYSISRACAATGANSFTTLWAGRERDGSKPIFSTRDFRPTSRRSGANRRRSSTASIRNRSPRTSV
ncbi:hypothetical protein ACVWZX_002945 [Deinococcus sp. UYEF24]